jgi:dipeptide/tripeptide permease
MNWGTSHPWIIGSFYALIPVSALYFFARPGSEKWVVWIVMLLISTLVSAVVGQMTSGLTLVIKEHVTSAMFGWSFPAEYFAGIFGGFIIFFSLLLARLKKSKKELINYRNAFPLGFAGFALAMAVIGVALSIAHGSKVSAWFILGAYALKALAEVLIVPTALALMHDVSSKDETAFSMSIWLLGAGLGVNLSKMLGLSMGKGTDEIGGFLIGEAAVLLLFMALIWWASRWLGATAEEIKRMRENAP